MHNYPREGNRTMPSLIMPKKKNTGMRGKEKKEVPSIDGTEGVGFGGPRSSNKGRKNSEKKSELGQNLLKNRGMVTPIGGRSHAPTGNVSSRRGSCRSRAKGKIIEGQAKATVPGGCELAGSLRRSSHTAYSTLGRVLFEFVQRGRSAAPSGGKKKR